MRQRSGPGIAVPLLGLLTAGLLGCAASRLTGRAAPTPVPRPPRDETAIRQFEQARQLAEFEAARACWRRGDGPGCQGRLEHLLARCPEHKDGRLLMAEMLSATGRAPEAAAHLRRLIAMHPDNARAQYALGRLSETQGQLATAVACYERAARLQPDNQQYVASYRRAVIAAGNPTAASVRVDPPASSSGGVSEPATTAAVFPPSPAARPDRTAAPASFTSPVGPPGDDQQGTELEPAGPIDAATRSPVSAGPVLPEAIASRVRRGGESLSAGDSEGAMRQFRAAIAARPEDPAAAVAAACVALEHNRPELAIELLGQTTGTWRNSTAVCQTLATAYYRRGEYEAARAILQHALTLDCSSALTHYLMGCTLIKLGERDGAESHLREAERLKPRCLVN